MTERKLLRIGGYISGGVLILFGIVALAVFGRRPPRLVPAPVPGEAAV